MKRRFTEYMNGVRPSEEFLDNLETEMNRELLRRRHAAARRRRSIRYAAVAAVAVMAVAVGLLALRPTHPDVVGNPLLAVGKGGAPSPTPGVDPTPSPAPESTAEPTATPTVGTTSTATPMPTASAAPTAAPENRVPVQPTPSATPMPAASVAPTSGPTDPDPIMAKPSPEGGWLELEMLNETLPGDSASFFLASHFYGCNGNYPMEIHANPELGSEIIAVLQPGMPHWISDEHPQADVFDENGEDIGFADYVLWWDAKTFKLNAGWHITKEGNSLGDEISPEISVNLPGKVREDGAVLRYAPDENAPVVANLAADDTFYLYAREENWIFVAEQPFSGEPLHGWIHVSDLYGMNWSNQNAQLYLAVDSAEIRETPEGKVVGMVTREEADEGKLFYLGSVGSNGKLYYKVMNVLSNEFKNQLYHWVMLGERIAGDDPIIGYIPAEACTLPGEDQYQSLEVIDEDYWVSDSLFDHAAEVYGGTGNRPLEVYAEADYGAAEPFALLDAGVPCWHDDSRENQKLFDGGEAIGYAEPILWWDDSTQVLCTGWRFFVGWEVDETVNEPEELIMAPGKVREGGTSLYYGRDKTAPVVTTLEPGQIIYLYCRVDNWVFAACGMDEACGWVHVEDVVQLMEREPLNGVELLADVVNLRKSPDGEIIGSISREDDALLRYAQATVPGKNGDWHYVIVDSGEDLPKEIQYAYISADYTKLNTFTLDQQLSMDGIVSCTLRYTPTEHYAEIPPAEQTITGDRLERFVIRLAGAYSEQIFEEVCAQGIATLTLNYADGSEAIVNLAGDSCAMVGYGDVIYDLKTAEERTERFLNDGGVGLVEILPQYFDEIDFYWD